MAAQWMKSNKKGSRGSMTNRHLKNLQVQNTFGVGGSNSLNWRTEVNKISPVTESNNFGYTNHYVASAFYMLIGLQVEIQKTDGCIYEGILETVSIKVEFHLSHAHKKGSCSEDSNKNEKKYKKIIFSFNDVVSCRARNVDLDYAKRDTLLTDSAITGSTNGVFNERELVQWQPDDPNDDLNLELGELGDIDNGVGWAFDEMMRVNEEEHGVKSTFDVSMSSYMTPLDKGNEEEFRAREKRAEQVAGEIQKNPKFKEVEKSDSGVSEEVLFSSVSRAPNNTNNTNDDININMNKKKDDNFKEIEKGDSGIVEEDLHNTVSQTRNIANDISNSSNHNNYSNNDSPSNSPSNNDGFITYTGKNYRTGRHSKAPQSVVGPRLQRNLRTHEGQNQIANGGKHQVNKRNHSNQVTSPQKSQNAYQHHTSSQHSQQQHPQQQMGHRNIENQHKIPGSHQIQENIGPTHNNRTQGDIGSNNFARTTLSYSAVAMKKNPTNSPSNNRTHSIPQPVIPPQPVVADVIQPIQQLEELNTIHSSTPSAVASVHTPISTSTSTSSAIVTNGHVTPPSKNTQSPISQPQLAAAKQQVIQEAKKKANLGNGGSHSTSLVSAADTAAVSLPPSEHPPSNTQNIEFTEKPTESITADNVDKSNVILDTKTEHVIMPSLPSPLGEDGQPFLMKFGKMNIPAEEKKGSSIKELKDFGEQFKLKEKPKNRQKSKDGSPKSQEIPIKSSDKPGKVKGGEKSVSFDASSLPAESSIEENASSNDVVIVSTSHAASHVTSSTATTTTTMTSNTTPSLVDTPPSKSSKSALNPAAKEFNLNPSAKTFSPSPMKTHTQPSSGDQVQQIVQHHAYYHNQAVMIHPNGSEVMSPTIQSVPVKQIYARPYMSSGPGGPAVYSIPTVEFANNGNSATPRLITPQAANYIPTQGMPGQQVIVIHGPNGSYQHVVPGNQGQQQYYQMQQMVRYVHPGGNAVQQTGNPRMPANFPPSAGAPPPPQGYVLAVSQHAGLVQHQVPPNQHQAFHPPPQPPQSTHIQTQYAMAHQVAQATSYPQNPTNAATPTYTQPVVPKPSNGGGTTAYGSPSSIHTVAGQRSFVMMTHQGQHVQTVQMANTQTYVQGQSHGVGGGGGIVPNYQAGN